MLGEPEKVTDTTTHTKDRILLESARLFATRGYDAVSIRDIAAQVEVRASSIYAHYIGKEEILDEVIRHTVLQMNAYYARLRAANRQAGSIREVVSNLFLEVKIVNSLFVYYGISTAHACMLWHAGARELFMQAFYENGVRVICESLREATERGLAEPFDCEVYARIIMNAVFTHNKLRVAESEQVPPPFDIPAAYDQLEQFLLRALKAG